MRAIPLGTLFAVSAGAAVKTLPGVQTAVFVGSPGADFAGTAAVQTSADGTTWADAVAIAATTKADVVEITTSTWARLNVTARTAGSVTAKLLV
jgi:hypothetical protein